ncbi:hypothetical protein [Streptomyces albipurpureus]|uniref:Uncharacterized protein n=1 Tax=Streptomyces albipurpureus TaxID=2897419 RepID=A0ABT0UZS6_9ACTN|nr:hypothetical protein [Streptomyces sp. CWNU-1]MCM2393160.1 hypothetical protein [Streptomyces sp. CWNU-1]
MSLGQGGPQWGSGGQHQDPYNSRQGAPDSFDPFGGQRGAGDPDTPDWAALAEASAARARRKRWLLIGGGALATAAVAGIVATAIVSSNDDSDNRSKEKSSSQLPAPENLPSDTNAPEPSFSSVAPAPPPNPKDFVSSEQKDKAPLTVDTLFPGKKLTMAGRSYAKGATARAATCTAAVQGGLGPVLERNGCDQVFRATYSKDGVAVTVGVAVFGLESEAKKAVEERRRGQNLAPLPGSGVSAFCKAGPVCRFTANSYGRYAYFTTTGYTNGKNVETGDTKAFQTGDDLAEFTFRQIVGRGNAQASAAVADPAG